MKTAFRRWHGRACVALSVLLVLGVAGVDAAARRARVAKAAEPRVWITMASDELELLRGAAKGAELDRLPQAFDSYEGVSVALVRDADLDLLAGLIHERFQRCAGFIYHDTRDEALQALYAPAALATELAYTIDNAPAVTAISAQVNPANIVATVQQLSSYPTRHYRTATGRDAALWLKSHWETIAAGRPDVSVQLFNHPMFSVDALWVQPSVIATIQGTDFPKEVVVLGGHVDSTRTGTATAVPAPGADDDASGIASITEAFRAAIAAGFRPARTVKFMAYAAEEGGLRGSKEIAQALNPSTGLTKLKVIGAFQLDMTNFKSTASNAVDVGVLTDAAHTNPAQTQFMRNLIMTYQPALTWADTTCGYGCSDHSAWHIQGGVPASMAFEGKFGQHSSNLHTANDTLANADTTGAHAAKFTRLAIAYMAELAKGSITP